MTPTPDKLRCAAEQLREDAVDCWGIRRKLNLKSAANLLEAAAKELESRTLTPAQDGVGYFS